MERIKHMGEMTCGQESRRQNGEVKSGEYDTIVEMESRRREGDEKQYLESDSKLRVKGMWERRPIAKGKAGNEWERSRVERGRAREVCSAGDNMEKRHLGRGR